MGISALHKRYFYNFSESSGNCRMILSKNESAPISLFSPAHIKKSHSSNFLGLPRTRCYSGLKIIYLLSNRTKLSAEHHSLYILFTWPLDIASNNQHSWSPFFSQHDNEFLQSLIAEISTISKEYPEITSVPLFSSSATIWQIFGRSKFVWNSFCFSHPTVQCLYVSPVTRRGW